MAQAFRLCHLSGKGNREQIRTRGGRRQAAGISKVASEKAVDGALDAIKGALKKGQSVTLVGFGTFKVGTARGAARAQSADRSGNPHQGRAGTQVQRWQGIER